MFVYMCLVYADELIEMECKSHFDRSRIILQPVPLESLLLSTKRLERDDYTHRGKERDSKGIMCYLYPCRYHKTIFVVLQSFVLRTP